MLRPIAFACFAACLAFAACDSKDSGFAESKPTKTQFKKLKLNKTSFTWLDKKYEQLAPSTSNGYQEGKTWVGGARFSDFNFSLNMATVVMPDIVRDGVPDSFKGHDNKEYTAIENGYLHVTEVPGSGRLTYVRLEKEKDSSLGIECRVAIGQKRKSQDRVMPGAEELAILKQVCDSLKRVD